MKKIISLLVLIILAPLVLAPLARADQCTDRTVKLAKPLFPRSLEQIEVMQREGSCIIHVAYSINGDGRAENINYMAEKPVCANFNVNAIRAIRSSNFTGGEYVQTCYIRVTFTLENGEMVWRYDPE